MTERIKRIYVDTSVVDAIADDEVKRRHTKPFWNAVMSGSIRVIFSDILAGEIEGAPPLVRDL